MRLAVGIDKQAHRLGNANCVGYLYEHREEADHHALNMTLRSLLFGTRKEGF